MTAAVTPAAPAKVIENLIEVRGLLSQFGNHVVHEGLDLTLEHPDAAATNRYTTQVVRPNP